jgi:hypothetical protein
VKEEWKDADWDKVENQSTKFASDLTDDGQLYPAVCSDGTSPGMWMLSPFGSNAITAFYSRNRVFAFSASAAPEVSARTLSVITFSRRPTTNWPPCLLSLPAR